MDRLVSCRAVACVTALNRQAGSASSLEFVQGTPMPNRARAKLVGTALALSTLVSQPARAEGYVFDGKRTEVRFAYQIGLAKQQGRFTRVSGTLQFEAPERSQVVAVVGNRKSRDRPVARRR